MARLDDDEALILTQARRALSPTSADEQRLLQSLLPQLALPPSAPSSGSPSRSSWTLRALASLGVIGAVALSGGLGYQKGVKAGIAQQNRLSSLANAVVVASAMPAQAVIDVALPAPPVRTLASAPKSSAASAARVRSEPPAPPAAPAPSTAPSALGLDEEVRQLRRVERAIREGNPRLALVLLEDLDRAIPKGQLLEERHAASIMADCQLGADDAVTRAHAFATKHAGSAYLSRVIELCGLESERNSAAPGTHVPR